MNGNNGPLSVKPTEDAPAQSTDESKETSSKPGRKSEPNFENLPNFSRVTPSQLSYITFPPRGRYQPVRFVSDTSGALGTPTTAALGSRSELYGGGGGGIIILDDERPDEDAEYIDFNPPAPQAPVVEPATTTTPAPASARRPNIALDNDEPEANPPPSFEVSLEYVCSKRMLMFGT